MSLVALGAVLYGLIFLYLTNENSRRDAGKDNEVIVGLDEDQVVALGDENPRFRYAT